MDVLVETTGAVTVIRMNRPDRRNAVDGPMARALPEAFLAFEADPSQRVAVLAGEGGTFCAGADLTSVGDPARATSSTRRAEAPARWDRPGCGWASP